MSATVPVSDATSGGAGRPSGAGTLEFLLRRLRLRSDFPTMTASIASINRLAASDDTTSARLAAEILKDLALTNKMLRLVNSAQYAQYATPRISTISRAIVILGVDRIRNLTLSLMLFEQLRDRVQAEALGSEFLRASFAALLARELCGTAFPGSHPEEAYLCALFHRLGRLLARCYLGEEADEVRRRVEAPAGAMEPAIDEEAAAMQVLGISYSALGIAVARSWGFPETMIHSMRPMPPGPVPPAHSAQDRLRALSAFSSEFGELVERGAVEQRGRAIEALCQRYRDCIGMGASDAQSALARAGKGLIELAELFHLDLADTALGRQLSVASARASATLAGGRDGPVLAIEACRLPLVDVASPGAAAEPAPPEPGGEPEAILAQGIQDISNALLEDGKLGDLLRIVTETLFRALPARRVILCLRDGRTRRMQARMVLGDDLPNPAASPFQFDIEGPEDLFRLILAQDVDVLIDDARDARVAQRLPGWYLRHFAAPCFLVLPLRLRGVPVAMIYVDTTEARRLKLSPAAFAQLRTLRNQAVLAIRQHL